MIPVYIGISDRFRFLEGMTEGSILAHTNGEVSITHLYPDVEAGCTGFSNVRYGIKRGIYLDVDMIVLGDIAELWSYRKSGKFVCLQDGATEVAVIDCDHNCRNKHEQHKLPISCDIPKEWNVRDCDHYGEGVPEYARLFHFTAMNTQPWFFDHPDPEHVALYEKWRKD